MVVQCCYLAVIPLGTLRYLSFDIRFSINEHRIRYRLGIHISRSQEYYNI